MDRSAVPEQPQVALDYEAIAVRSRSQRTVLPSMSVKRKVTVPLGRSGMIRLSECGLQGS